MLEVASVLLSVSLLKVKENENIPEKIRRKNNGNWMNILRLAFKLDPKSAAKIMKKINYDDKKISNLLTKLSK